MSMREAIAVQEIKAAGEVKAGGSGSGRHAEMQKSLEGLVKVHNGLFKSHMQNSNNSTGVKSKLFSDAASHHKAAASLYQDAANSLKSGDESTAMVHFGLGSVAEQRGYDAANKARRL